MKIKSLGVEENAILAAGLIPQMKGKGGYIKGSEVHDRFRKAADCLIDGALEL